MPRNYSRTRAWGCAANAGGWLPAPTGVMIGDASGKEGQFSDSDKKTAENFGCEYMDVDDFVYKYNN